MIGETVDGHEVLEELGRGGMGIVYRAREVVLGRDVALKVLPPHLPDRAAARERFLRGAQAMARLDHPNIATVYRVGEWRDSPYFTMQLLPGGTLGDLLARRGRLSWKEAAAITAQIARALHEAHRQGVVHRDIKPANLMFDEAGRPVVTDFGIARLMDSAGITTTGMALGTLEYMSPEQVQGTPADGRSDLYALGVVLYHMVCGAPPFAGETPFSVAFKHVNETPPAPEAHCPDIPAWASAVILRAMAKDPDERLQTGEEIAQALEGRIAPEPTVEYAPPEAEVAALQAPEGYPAPEPTVEAPPSPPPTSQPRRKGLALVVSGFLGLLAIVLVALAVHFHQGGGNGGGGGSPPPPKPAPSPPIEPGRPAIPPRPDPSHPPRDTVPNVIGLPEEEAIKLLLGEGFVPEVRPWREYDDAIPAGHVRRQWPGPGDAPHWEPGKGWTVGPVVSEGRYSARVPPEPDAVYEAAPGDHLIDMPAEWLFEEAPPCEYGEGFEGGQLASPDGIAKVLVYRGPARKPPATTADDADDHYSDTYPRYDHREKIRKSHVRGRPAASWGYRVSRSKEDDPWWRTREWIINDGETQYIVSCTARDDIFDKYESLFDKILESFRFEDGEG